MRIQEYEALDLATTLLTCIQRGDPMEVSLSMVPPTHPLIPPRNLEAEASGLLDRLLEVFEPNSPHNGYACFVILQIVWLTPSAMLYWLMLL